MEVLQIEVPLYYQESIDSENTSIFLRQHSIPTLRFKLDQPVIYISWIRCHDEQLMSSKKVGWIYLSIIFIVKQHIWYL